MWHARRHLVRGNIGLVQHLHVSKHTLRGCSQLADISRHNQLYIVQQVFLPFRFFHILQLSELVCTFETSLCDT